MSELFQVTIPRSALCPHFSNGKYVQCHEHIPMKRRKGEVVQRWKCKICRKQIRWDSDYSVYVTSYLIEEVPW